MVKKLITLLVLFLHSPVYCEDLTPWTITVRAYAFGQIDEFPQLEMISKIAVNETAKGFLNRNTIYREAFHYGATFCLLVDFRIDESEKQKTRIIEEFKKIPIDDDKFSIEILNPSDCFEPTSFQAPVSQEVPGLSSR
jgi:hypothetical protein